jgi:hypothetical protein
VLVLGRGASGGRAQIHHELERGHLHGFLDALAELRLDALHQPARIAVLVREGAARGHSLMARRTCAEAGREGLGLEARFPGEEARGVGHALVPLTC